MKSTPPAVKAYLSALPPDRLAAISTVREVIHKNLDPKLEEGVQYGMISYYVPHSVFPAGYHCDPKQPLLYAALASQKGYLSLYLMGIYMEEAERAWLEAQFRRAGKKLDAGKSCIRFKRVEDLPLDVIGEAFRRVSADRYLARYLANLGSRGKGGKKAAEKAAATAAKAEATKPAKPAAKAAKPAAKAAKPAATKAAKPAAKAAKPAATKAAKPAAKAAKPAAKKAAKPAATKPAKPAAKAAKPAVKKPAKVAAKAAKPARKAAARAR